MAGGSPHTAGAWCSLLSLLGSSIGDGDASLGDVWGPHSHYSVYGQATRDGRRAGVVSVVTGSSWLAAWWAGSIGDVGGRTIHQPAGGAKTTCCTNARRGGEQARTSAVSFRLVSSRGRQLAYCAESDRPYVSMCREHIHTTRPDLSGTLVEPSRRPLLRRAVRLGTHTHIRTYTHVPPQPLPSLSLAQPPRVCTLRSALCTRETGTARAGQKQDASSAHVPVGLRSCSLQRAGARQPGQGRAPGERAFWRSVRHSRVGRETGSVASGNERKSEWEKEERPERIDLDRKKKESSLARAPHHTVPCGAARRLSEFCGLKEYWME